MGGDADMALDADNGGKWREVEFALAVGLLPQRRNAIAS